MSIKVETSIGELIIADREASVKDYGCASFLGVLLRPYRKECSYCKTPLRPYTRPCYTGKDTPTLRCPNPSCNRELTYGALPKYMHTSPNQHKLTSLGLRKPYEEVIGKLLEEGRN